jgi:hypothetical protein
VNKDRGRREDAVDQSVGYAVGVMDSEHDADGSVQSRAPYLIEPHVQSRHTATTVTFDSSVLFSDRVG